MVDHTVAVAVVQADLELEQVYQLPFNLTQLPLEQEARADLVLQAHQETAVYSLQLLPLAVAVVVVFHSEFLVLLVALVVELLRLMVEVQQAVQQAQQGKVMLVVVPLVDYLVAVVAAVQVLLVELVAHLSLVTAVTELRLLIQELL